MGRKRTLSPKKKAAMLAGAATLVGTIAWATTGTSQASARQVRTASSVAAGSGTPESWCSCTAGGSIRYRPLWNVRIGRANVGRLTLSS